MVDNQDPIERFSDRVENYAKYRPDYPPEVLDLCARCLDKNPAERPTALMAALLLAEAVDARVYVPLMDLGPATMRQPRVPTWNQQAADAPTSVALPVEAAEPTDRVGRHRA